MPTEATRDLVSDWLIGYPARTKREYRADFDQYTEWLASTDPLDADRARIQRFLAHLGDQDLSDATIRRKSSAISSFYTYAVQEKRLEHNPAALLRRPKGESAPRRGLEVDQAHQLIAAARTHSRSAHALIWLMAGAGLRISEACGALIEDLKDDLLTVTVKGGHRKIKPLSVPVLTAVTTAIADRDHGPILTNRDGNPLSVRRASALIEELTGRAGLTDCTAHTLRHTAATLALAAGVPIQDVKELLGHRSLETTLLYIRNRDILGGTRNAAQALGDVLDPGDEEE